jgi:hypothetical protein
MNSYIRGFFLLGIFLTSFSCDDDDAAECTGNLCPFVGNWQLTEVSVDGHAGNGDYAQYRLNLSAPVGDNAIASYSRNFDNDTNESGTWTVSVNTDVLMLTGDGVDEIHVVEEIGPNILITVLHRESMKGGPEQLRYVFTK